MCINCLYFIVLALIILALGKWMLIFIVMPFQVIYNHRLKKGKNNKLLKIMSAPYYLWEIMFREGWERYMLYQVGTIPSNNLRKTIYRLLGASVLPKAIFHFRTEIRRPWKLQIGGGHNYW